MTSTINASTVAGIVTTADTSGVLALQTAGTTALTVDASQRVGVGVTPSAWESSLSVLQLNVSGSISSGLSGNGTYLAQNWYYNGGDKFVGNGYASYYEQNKSTGTHAWVRSLTSNSSGAGQPATMSTSLSINVNGGLQTINTIGVGNTTPSTSGAGITFPASQSASTDVNTLDDYEEGTFTPSFTSTGLTVTYDQQRGIYTKIGRSVTVSMYMQVSGKSGTLTNPLKITGLPFTSTSGFEYGFSAAVGVQQFSTYSPTLFVGASSTEVAVYRNGTVTSMTGTELNNGLYLLTITYFT
jgi:hypothetical protein